MSRILLDEELQSVGLHIQRDGGLLGVRVHVAPRQLQWKGRRRRMDLAQQRDAGLREDGVYEDHALPVKLRMYRQPLDEHTTRSVELNQTIPKDDTKPMHRRTSWVYQAIAECGDAHLVITVCPTPRLLLYSDSDPMIQS